MRLQKAVSALSQLPALLMHYGIPANEVISAQYDATIENVNLRVHLLHPESLSKIGIPNSEIVQGRHDYTWTSYHLIKHGISFVANGPAIAPEYVEPYAMPF
ncbi:hypothetical protein FCT18_14570 [Lysinibacillus sphaericus]|uniref:Uncharacterized protein n=1 Tax=Lysinibacillus sphaericus TaxID=1421 RepID=A0A2S0K679_LYSSH|nr:hypothetical protein [Lysinibacillus sphaericus]AVK98880.1 hypothetical protein LS41612_22600 [Lysinibacillus sphaericus]MED4545257.1 hypothetical protein [Lysinibacillus sphaericus]TKI18319.1 hypothetical protein FCT18_14570 [Lysinibacillus sphaericus]SUV15101.1 Uncharacterised protein [Lysinibacillus sphaericus]GEC82238.1 hypothetical protein LSP03_19810 [Lysinibacillus sphaericus]